MQRSKVVEDLKRLVARLRKSLRTKLSSLMRARTRSVYESKELHKPDPVALWLRSGFRNGRLVGSKIPFSPTVRLVSHWHTARLALWTILTVLSAVLVSASILQVWHKMRFYRYFLPWQLLDVRNSWPADPVLIALVLLALVPVAVHALSRRPHRESTVEALEAELGNASKQLYVHGCNNLLFSAISADASGSAFRDAIRERVQDLLDHSGNLRARYMTWRLARTNLLYAAFVLPLMSLNVYFVAQAQRTRARLDRIIHATAEAPNPALDALQKASSAPVDQSAGATQVAPIPPTVGQPRGRQIRHGTGNPGGKSRTTGGDLVDPPTKDQVISKQSAAGGTSGLIKPSTRKVDVVEPRLDDGPRAYGGAVRRGTNRLPSDYAHYIR